jgi:hypothetical protein
LPLNSTAAVVHPPSSAMAIPWGVTDMAKKILKGVKKAAGVAAGGFLGKKFGGLPGMIAGGILGSALSKGKKKAKPTVVDAPLNPMLSVSTNMEKENRATMRKRAQSGSNTILSDTLG